jgi:hypothetical protein
MPKVTSIDKIVTHYNGGEWMLDQYPPFAEQDKAEEWLKTDRIDLDRAKELVFELGGDEAFNYSDEINEAKDLWELQDVLDEFKYFQRDNTYNSSWWGGVVDFGVLTEDGEGYGKGLVLLRMHRGGDPRGNYYDIQAFELDSFIEDFPPYYSRLTYQINTDNGTITLDTDDLEGYTLMVVDDETGTFEVDDYVKIDEVENALDMDGNDFYSWGGGIAIGGILGGYLGYKVGRARPQKGGFATEKKIGKKIKETAKSMRKKERGGTIPENLQAKVSDYIQVADKEHKRTGKHYIAYYDDFENEIIVEKRPSNLDKLPYYTNEVIMVYDTSKKERGGDIHSIEVGNVYHLGDTKYLIIWNDGYNIEYLSRLKNEDWKDSDDIRTINVNFLGLSQLFNEQNYVGKEQVQGVTYAEGGMTEHGLKEGDLVQGEYSLNSDYIEVKNLDENREYLVNLQEGERERPYATGGTIDVGSEIEWNDNRRGLRRGTIMREVDDNNWEVMHKWGYTMVGKNEVLGIAPPPSRKFRLFEDGGEIDDIIMG